MSDLWDSCPMKGKPTSHYYDLMRPFESATYKLDLEMWSWLEKVKAELDKMIEKKVQDKYDAMNALFQLSQSSTLKEEC